MTQTLFGKKVVSSVSFSQEEILQDINTLYLAGAGFECDCTYSIGNFYKAIPEPKYKFDLAPEVPGVIEADSRSLPLPNSSLRSLMYDPPFIASWSVESDEYVQRKRFSAFRGIKQLQNCYTESIQEAHRVLAKRGVYVVKCQDTVDSGRNHFNHLHVCVEAENVGFVPIDIFILIAKTRFIGSHAQKHSRKFHSYFWVFKKR